MTEPLTPEQVTKWIERIDDGDLPGINVVRDIASGWLKTHEKNDKLKKEIASLRKYADSVRDKMIKSGKAAGSIVAHLKQETHALQAELDDLPPFDCIEDLFEAFQDFVDREMESAVGGERLRARVELEEKSRKVLAQLTEEADRVSLMLGEEGRELPPLNNALDDALKLLGKKIIDRRPGRPEEK